jgi:hypothetical protein
MKQWNRCTSICLGFLVVLAMAGGCAREKVVPPAPQLFAPGPVIVAANTLFKDYLADQNSADLKYKNKTIWLTDATVDASIVDANSSYFQMELIKVSAFKSEEGVAIPTLVWSQKVSVHFREQYAVGDIFELIGVCQGMTDSGVIIPIDWINRTSGGPPRAAPDAGSYQ